MFAPLYSLSAECLDSIQPPSVPIASLRAIGSTSHHDHDFAQVVRFSLRLHAEDRLGLPLSRGASCFNHIRVSAAAYAVNGTLIVRAVPAIVATPLGYNVSLALHAVDDAEWRIGASVVWEAFDRLQWWRSDRPAARNDSGCKQPPLEQPELYRSTLTARMTQPAAHHEHRQAQNASARHACLRRAIDLGALHRIPGLRTVGGCTQGSSLSCASEGPLAWRPAASCPTASTIAATSATAAISATAATSATATTSADNGTARSTSRARAALTGKWVLFIGASTQLEVFFFLLSHLANGGGFPHYQSLGSGLIALKDSIFSHESKSCTGHANYYHRDYDTCMNASLQACLRRATPPSEQCCRRTRA